MTELLLLHDQDRLFHEFDTDLLALRYVLDNTFRTSSTEVRNGLQTSLLAHQHQLPPAISNSLKSEWQKLKEARTESPDRVADTFIFGGICFRETLRRPIYQFRQDLSWLHKRLEMLGRRRLEMIIDSHHERLTWTTQSILQREWLMYELALEQAA